ncbi:hypothetical protein J2S17_003385 [Cytobacillus purgationiresistens]|uniref:Uncharacterized protein n=1 Tax=Cytobacillus purgationiresistens TaxID=863449 RepID=A0ABU0AJQ3_9BACI|nr:hypothetical protein [Cytobacillus purgationiresistens]
MITMLIGADVRDYYGSSGTGETPQEHSEAHRPPRGKRAPGEEINHYLRKAPKYTITA